MNGLNMSPTVLLKPTFNINNLIFLLTLSLLLSLGSAFNMSHINYAHKLLMWLSISTIIYFQWHLYKFAFNKIFNNKVCILCLTFILIWLNSTWQINSLKLTGLVPKVYDPYFEFLWFMLPIMLSVCSIFIFTEFIENINIKDKTLKKHKDIKNQFFYGIDTSQIQTINSQQHYILISTSEKTELIRSPLKSAIKALNAENGLQVHKSWWVRRDCIAFIKRNNRDFKITLKNGTIIPVSRTRIEELKSKGWM